MSFRIALLQVRYENDVVQARQRARQIAALAGFSPQMQTRFATAVSELTRNVFRYAVGGTVEFLTEEDARQRQLLLVRVTDRGPGIVNLDEIFNGRYRSATGMGMGLLGTKRLMDHFSIISSPEEGTTVVTGLSLPAGARRLNASAIAHLAAESSRQAPQDPYAEIQRQNQELLETLDSLRQREEELLRTNLELEDTNRGVVALYAELDEKANYLRRADEVKDRFLSDLSHELRTPLNSVLALSRMLLDRTDGDLSAEQEKQINFIRKAAESLYELVNDLLDISKIASGKTTVDINTFGVRELFSALRGMLRPLQSSSSVSLLIEDPPEDLMMETDERKVAQILRNLISNALKFTETGQVHVTATYECERGCMAFRVVDTGIGITADNLEAIFQEFVQVENHLQRRTKGTGLGLPLSRKLSELLGGSLTVESVVGVGSTFTAVIPARFSTGELSQDPMSFNQSAATSEKLLIIDDEEASRYVLRSYLDEEAYTVLEAENGADGLRLAREFRPGAIFLDLTMQPMSGLEVLDALKADPITSHIPVIINTSRTLAGDEVRHLEPLVLDILSKDNSSRDAAFSRIRELLIAARRESKSALKLKHP